MVSSLDHLYLYLSPVITSISPDKRMLGTPLGMSIAFLGFGVFIGEPVAGLILGALRIGLASSFGVV